MVGIQLEEFVAETISQVIRGVAAAIEEADKQDAKVNPRTGPSQATKGRWDMVTGTPIQEIEFDVAVTTSGVAKTKGRIEVFVGPVALSSTGQSDAATQAVSRVKFCVPIRLPVGER